MIPRSRERGTKSNDVTFYELSASPGSTSPGREKKEERNKTSDPFFCFLSFFYRCVIFLGTGNLENTKFEDEFLLRKEKKLGYVSIGRQIHPLLVVASSSTAWKW